MPTVEEVTRKYIELRDRTKEIAKRHAEELVPYNEAMATFESWFLNKMNELSVDSLKNAAGTPYRVNSNSVNMNDPLAFKAHVFSPVADSIYHYLCAVGYPIQPADIDAIKSMLLEKPSWDMVDFRAGKKNILEYQEQHGQLPPGVSVETMQKVNVRRS